MRLQGRVYAKHATVLCNHSNHRQSQTHTQGTGMTCLYELLSVKPRCRRIPLGTSKSL